VNANTAKDATFDIFLAGDAMLVSPWSRAGDDATLRLFSAMREADVTILNLETVIHSFEGYAQANSGGSWMRSPPEIAQELAWAGVDMVAHANNHSFDYGSEGILQTIRHVDAAGIAISGSGRDLQQARSPRYVERSGRTVAHVAMASDFISYGKASLSLPGLRGRPGLNPLSLERKASMTVPRWAVSLIKTLDGLLGRNTERYELPNFSKNGVMISTGQTFSYQRGPRVDMADARGNIDAIVEARSKADIVVVSIHAHKQNRWLRPFAAQAIEAGADVVLAHGPHEIRGIEIIGGCPVFFGLGDFAYQADQVELMPPEAYDRAGLDYSASARKVRRSWPPTARLESSRETYEGLAARIGFRGDQAASIELLPVDLRHGEQSSLRGCPRLADQSLGERLIARAAKASRKYGTKIRFDPETNSGRIDLRCPEKANR
jgi:poly-gamma-glutamate capsule biosynthesis protein CapA/YwtB (metallophosphatase superfamily)